MSRIIVQPYNQASRSAKALANELGCRRVRLVRTRFRPQPGDKVINWGSKRPMFSDDFYFNRPDAVADASNKKRALRYMEAEGVPVVPFTHEVWQAQEWIDAGHVVVARTTLSGHSGSGIVMCNQEFPLVAAPLYTQYVPKKWEYRVHVVGGEVAYVQEKRARTEVPREERNYQIRNHGNGFCYCTQNVTIDDEVKEIAVRAAGALGLDYGAVDIGRSQIHGIKVYEVNTAPGLEGSTGGVIAAAIRRYIA